MSNSFELVEGHVYLIAPDPFRQTVPRLTARYDAQVEVPAGRYELAAQTIGGVPTTYDEAYYFVTSIEGRLVAGGFDDESPGDPIQVRIAPYGFAVRKELEEVRS